MVRCGVISHGAAQGKNANESQSLTSNMVRGLGFGRMSQCTLSFTGIQERSRIKHGTRKRKELVQEERSRIQVEERKEVEQIRTHRVGVGSAHHTLKLQICFPSNERGNPDQERGKSASPKAGGGA